MTGFIKITDVQNRVHYINVNHIIKFTTADARATSNTIIRIIGGDNTTAIQTSTTPEEIMDMIDLATK
jgi:hypothetical protein